MTTVRAWYSRQGEPIRPWRMRYEESGRLVECSSVSFRSCVTKYSEDGFKELPDGPKGIVEGELLLSLNELPLPGAK